MTPPFDRRRRDCGFLPLEPGRRPAVLQGSGSRRGGSQRRLGLEVLSERTAAVRVADQVPVLIAAELADCLERFLDARADEPTMERARRALEAWRALVDESVAAEMENVVVRDVPLKLKETFL